MNKRNKILIIILVIITIISVVFLINNNKNKVNVSGGIFTRGYNTWIYRRAN